MVAHTHPEAVVPRDGRRTADHPGRGIECRGRKERVRRFPGVGRGAASVRGFRQGLADASTSACDHDSWRPVSLEVGRSRYLPAAAARMDCVRPSYVARAGVSPELTLPGKTHTSDRKRKREAGKPSAHPPSRFTKLRKGIRRDYLSSSTFPRSVQAEAPLPTCTRAQ